jgi:hypothetical protein
MSDDFSNATDALKNLFDRLMPENSRGYVGLFSGWKDIAGPEMSMHVFIVDVINGSLVLEADHPGWIQKVRMIQSRLLHEVGKRYPELGISRLRISLGKGRKNPVSRAESDEAAPMVEIVEKDLKKTPTVASDDALPDEDQPFHELLEKMRRRGNS